MADHTLTPEQIAMIDASVARVRAERADAGIMSAKYDAVCERLAELHDESVGRLRRIQALEDQLRDRDAELACTRALADRRWVAWQSARRRARQYRADRNLTHAVEDERASDTHPETNRSTTT